MSENKIDNNSLSFCQPSEVDLQKRDFLVKATAATGAVGVAAVAVPFVGSMLPSERAKAAGAPVEVDISKLKPGEKMTAEWRGQPVWIVRRTPEMLAKLVKHDDQLSDPNLEVPQQPEYCKNKDRSIKPEFAVMLGTCTHLGCSPNDNFAVTAEWDGGFVCPCHGSKFDLSGRVFKGSPAPKNLLIPPHQYLTDTTLLIGEDKKAEA
ncbi:ubiquinol-cytochrome c reductase iron-sulfur subunit [Methylophilus sp.]|jgi:ubiquinol-cytochrome c reductase iron-sulfur subunit|uniref:ubiquinol-cytochrome c reductase iron-sulfur subunit n=1 Tax=Methylophilus sp. TaxID=29541 RepID=UPI0011DA02DA|nr:ubiquinol-cytochrome c reductase iron-sulfur subunit [Methylophilus sp.]TXI44558.1 MAG: ubiquinol-cytochrome c reductase iron-sulfur subunit [Methylophilus sp.]